MKTQKLEGLIEAVLYEGYILYPYRASSMKNRQRFTFGRLYPEAYSRAEHGAEPFEFQTECLVKRRSAEATLEVAVRFLQPIAREVGTLSRPVLNWTDVFVPDFQIVPELSVDGNLFQTWQEAVEREIKPPRIRLCASDRRAEVPFSFPHSRIVEPIRDRRNRIAGVMVRRQEALEGIVHVSAHPLTEDLLKISIRVANLSSFNSDELADKDAVLMRTFASTHTLLQVQGGEFISLMDTPPEHKDAAAECRNIGTWPVLVGDEQTAERDTMLSSPIILYDYPKIAPENPGSFFDRTEIDEMLALRITTMTDAEKCEMRQVGEQARRLLDRTESLPDAQWLKLHGARRDLEPPEDQVFGANNKRLEGVSVGDVFLRAGDKIRLWPKVRADIIDIALKGKLAVVQAVEQDAEDRLHLAVVLDDDSGKDLDLLRQPGHRFFYGVDEVEPLLEPAVVGPTIH